MSANIERFTGLAGIYQKFRPGYPEELFTFLRDELGLVPGKTVAEIGSGTGIFTKLLLEHGLEKVYAVEPNSDMRREAETLLGAFPGFVSVAGTAEATGLEADAFDFIFAVQAFHWFDQAAFRAECRRILRTNGNVLIIWNTRTESPVMLACHEVCKRYCANFKGFSGHSAASGPEAIEAFFAGKYQFREFANPVSLSCDEFIGRNLSSSYAPRAGDANYEPFIKGFEEIFERYAENGRIIWGNATRCYWGGV